ncbi:MAG: FHA domain-containing protein [Ignavibacteriales bacterium]|nr:FHA domain-containing protein [Ignavibacteriales bacterium]
MKLKLFIKKQSDPSYSKELDFTRFPIFLGRDESNDIALPDAFKIISRKHARIIDTEGILQLIDLESANFTYLNEQKIEAGEENPLKSGDKIKIGDYELETLLLIDQEEKKIIIDDNQKTMVFSSPYADEMNNIVESLGKIAEKYSLEKSQVKSDALRFSVLQSLNRIEANDVNKILAEFFVEKFLGKEYHPFEKKGYDPNKKEIVDEPELNKSQSFKQTIEPMVNPNEPFSQDYSLSSHFTNILDILLDTFSKLIQGFLHFRQEFFGVTVFYTLPTGSLKELKEFLFNPAVSAEEEKKRIFLLKEEAQKLLAHQIGLLEGYMNSVTEGSKSLLQSLNPELIEAEMENKIKKTPGLDFGKMLPGSKKAKILESIKENYKKYISDPYHIEKKFFRPSFMKGYQKRISGKSQNEF